MISRLRKHWHLWQHGYVTKQKVSSNRARRYLCTCGATWTRRLR